MAKRLTKTILVALNERIEGIHNPLVAINDVNEDVIDLIDQLWPTQTRFAVSSPNYEKLNEVNTAMCNRSFSIDRWKVTGYTDLLQEPAHVLICFKELTDEQLTQVKAKFIFTFTKKEGSRYVYIGSKAKSDDSNS